MSHRKPISLALVLVLAFWTPMAICCDAAKAEAEAGAAQGSDTAIELCHGVPRAPSSDSDTPRDTDGCDDHDCACASHLLGTCVVRSSETRAVPSASSGHLLSAMLAIAPLQPQTWLPHTFFTTRLEPERFPLSLAAPSLVALSCQLTL